MSAEEFDALVAKAVSILEAMRFEAGYDAFSDNKFRSHISEGLYEFLDLTDVDKVQIPTLSGLATVDQSQHLKNFIEMAEMHPEAYEALIRRIAASLELGFKLHPYVAIWLAKTLRGEIKKAARQGRQSVRMRNIVIGKTIEEIAKQTGEVGGSDTSDNIRALDVVQKALGLTKFAAMDYENLKDIWEIFRRERLVIEFPTDEL